jgi:hypothetical protein
LAIVGTGPNLSAHRHAKIVADAAPILWRRTIGNPGLSRAKPLHRQTIASNRKPASP